MTAETDITKPSKFEGLGFSKLANDLPNWMQSRLLAKELSRTYYIIDEIFSTLPGSTNEEKKENLKENDMLNKYFEDKIAYVDKILDAADEMGPRHRQKILDKVYGYGSTQNKLKAPNFEGL